MKKHIPYLVLPIMGVMSLVLICLVGCGVFRPAPKPAPVQPAPVTVMPAPSPVEQATEAAQRARASQASAATEAALVATEQIREASPATATAKAELGVARAFQDPPTPEHRAAALERAAKGLRGELEAANAERSALLRDAKEAREQVKKLEAALEAARTGAAEALREREQEWRTQFDRQASGLREAEQRVKAKEEELVKEKAALAKRVQFWFALGLRLGALALLAIAGARIYGSLTTGLAIIPAVKGAALLLTCAAGAFLISWAVAQPWFYWACAGIIGIASLAVAYAVYHERRAMGTLSKVVTEVDRNVIKDALGNAITATVDLKELRAAMNTTEKALVREIKGT